jgi:hypothetical protein
MDLFAKKPEARVRQETGKDNPYKPKYGPLDLVLIGVERIIGADIFTLTGVAAATTPAQRSSSPLSLPPLAVALPASATASLRPTSGPPAAPTPTPMSLSASSSPG